MARQASALWRERLQRKEKTVMFRRQAYESVEQVKTLQLIP